MGAEPDSVMFETTVAVTGNNTGIVVPEEGIELLAAGQRPPVLVSVNGYEYRNTASMVGGRPMISISAAVRTGIKPGLPEGLADALHLDHGATDPANQCVRDPPGLASFTFDEAQPAAHAPATRSPTGSAPPKDRRKYCDPGEQEQQESGDVPEGGQYHHAE